jgi:hypothetical protein
MRKEITRETESRISFLSSGCILCLSLFFVFFYLIFTAIALLEASIIVHWYYCNDCFPYFLFYFILFEAQHFLPQIKHTLCSCCYSDKKSWISYALGHVWTIAPLTRYRPEPWENCFCSGWSLFPVNLWLGVSIKMTSLRWNLSSQLHSKKDTLTLCTLSLVSCSFHSEHRWQLNMSFSRLMD